MLRRLVAARPNLSQAHYLLGRIAIENEQWDEAINRPPARGRTSIPITTGRGPRSGFVYEAQNKLDEAVAVYKEALKANPDNAAFVERLGDLLVKLGRYGEAQSEIEALMESLPRDPRVWMKLGAVHYEQKQYDRAVAAFRQAVALEPGNMRTRYYLATALMDAGKDDEARDRAGEDPPGRSPLGRRAGAARLPPRPGQAATTRRSRPCRRR